MRFMFLMTMAEGWHCQSRSQVIPQWVDRLFTSTSPLTSRLSLSSGLRMVIQTLTKIQDKTNVDKTRSYSSYWLANSFDRSVFSDALACWIQRRQRYLSGFSRWSHDTTFTGAFVTSGQRSHPQPSAGDVTVNRFWHRRRDSLVYIHTILFFNRYKMFLKITFGITWENKASHTHCLNYDT